MADIVGNSDEELCTENRCYELSMQIEILESSNKTYIDENRVLSQKHHLLLNKIEYLNEKIAEWDKRCHSIRVSNNTQRNLVLKLRDKIRKLKGGKK